MADSIRIFGQFKDEQGTQWKVNVHDANFSGSPTEVVLSSEGFMLQYQGDNESRMQPIIGSALSFGIQVQTSAVEGILGLIETSDEGRFTCSVVKDPDGTPLLFWSGVILPDQVVKQDEYFPIQIQIRAVDDLGNLRNVKYKSGGVGYGGEMTLAQHMNQCVLKLRHVQNIPWGDPLVWWGNNFIATGINPALDQISRVGVHHAAFYARNDEGVAQFESTFDVLKAICMAMNCRFFQHEGAFWMVPVGIYGTFTTSATWTFYNIDGPGNISAGQSIDLGKIIGTDVVRMAGNEITHLPPLQEVRKIWRVQGEIPAVSVRQYLNGSSGFFTYDDLGTMVPDAGLGYAEDEELKLEGTLKASWVGNPALTGNSTIGTLFARMTIKVGNLYLVNSITYSTTAWLNVSWVDGIENRRPFSISDPVWQTTAGYYYRPIIQAVNLAVSRPQSNPWLHTIDVVLPALPSAQTGMEFTIDAIGRNYLGNSITNFTAATSWIYVEMLVRRLQENGEQMEAVTYVASFDTEAQTIIEQQHLVGSAQFSAGIDGNLLDMTGTPGDPISTFTSLARPSESAQPLHQIAATEILQGQKHATLIRRGRLFGDWISPLHWLILGTDKFLPFQTTYIANSCETDFEAFKVAFNGMDMQTPSIQGSFTDIETSGGSVTDVVLPVLEEAIEVTGKQLGILEGDVDLIADSLDVVKNQVKLIYETFNPKGADYGTTQVKYQQNKVDGTLMELQQNQMLLQSSTGNTQLLLSENSPGIIELSAQDELTSSHLAIHITANSTKGGMVGINRDTPERTLDVNGTARISAKLDGVTILGLATDQELPPGNGGITFNSDQNAFTLGLLNVQLKAGEDDHWICRNSTGSTIAAGVPVYASGTLGASGRKLIAPMVADGTINARYFLGITAQSISNDADGVVLDRGTIKGVNTNSFSAGDVLWISQTTAGTFTSTEPSTGMKIAAGFVVHAATNGVLAVRNLGAESSAGGNAFGTIAISGQSNVVADSSADTLTLVAGTNMVLSTDAGADSVTINTSTTPTFTSATINSGGIISVGSISTLGSVSASGNVSGVNGTFSGNGTFQGSLTAGTAILTGIQFTGGTTTSIGIATGLPNQPTDLQITSNGNVTILLDADTNETGQKFMVHDPSNTERFSISDTGAATFNNAFTLPTADGAAGQVLATDGDGSVGWEDVPSKKSSSATGYMEIKSTNINQIFSGPSNGIYCADYTTGNNTDYTYFHNGTAPTAGSTTFSTYPYYTRGGLIDVHHNISTISFKARLQDISQNAAGDQFWACIWHLSGGAAESFTSGTWTAVAVGTGTIPSTSANISLGKVSATATGLSISAGDSLWVTFGWIDQPGATPDVNVNWSLNMNE